MTSRSRTNTPSNHALHAPPPFPPPGYREERLHDHSSTSTSTTTSRHASNTSIFSLPFSHPHSRHSTPPTPTHSPGLFKPPSTVGNAEPIQHLHPMQYRQPDIPVTETNMVDVEYDPVSGRKTINNYTIIDEIGRGTHGKVKLGFDLDKGQLVAIKIVERTQGRPRLGRKGDGEDSENKIRREIAILKKIRHENVVRLLEVIDDARSKKVYLILEFVVLGEVPWRREGDPAVLHRDRRRLRREVAAIRAKSEALSRKSDSQGSGKKKKKARSNFWSLEFASDSDTDEEADSSDTESNWSFLEDEHYVPALEIEEARRSFRDTVVGLDYLHWNGIIHRDIKPANLLWNHEKVTKISDFGVSFLGRPLREEDDIGSGLDDEPTGFEQDELELAKSAGTPLFFAPELCTIEKPKPPITNAIDVWALGVTLFCFIYGRLPFNAAHEYTLFKCIAEEELYFPRRRIRAKKAELDSTHSRNMTPEELEEYETEPVHDDLRDLLKRLLIKDPVKRITLKEVKHHPWVLEGIADPIAWVERTDPERSSQGAKIEITTEDVETAVSYSGVLGRAKSAIKKAGTWYRGLRKQGSSRTKDLKERGSASTLDTESAERRGAYGHHMREESDDYSSHGEFREDERWHPLAPTLTNSSTGSSDTVLERSTARSEGGNIGPQPSVGAHFAPGASERKLRRKQSQRFLGGPGPVLRRHATTMTASDATGTVRDTHLAPTHAPPSSPQPDDAVCTVRAECGLAYESPTVVQHIVRSGRSRDLLRDSELPNDLGHSESPSRARAFLSRALNSAHSNVHTHNFRSGASDDSDSCARSYSSAASSESEMRLRMESRLSSRGEPWAMGQGSENSGRSDMTILPERRQSAVETSILPTTTPDGMSRARDAHFHWITPPIPMASRNNGYFFSGDEPESPTSGEFMNRGGNITSSSSDDRFATAGSSLTNSASIASALTQPSSFNSDFPIGYYSRKTSAGTSELADHDEEQRARRASLQRQQRRNSDFMFPPDDPDEEEEDAEGDSDSEGGFVLKRDNKSKVRRGQSIAVGALLRQSSQEKDAALSASQYRTHVRNRSKSSGGSTVKHKTESRGRPRKKSDDGYSVS